MILAARAHLVGTLRSRKGRLAKRRVLGACISPKFADYIESCGFVVRGRCAHARNPLGECVFCGDVAP